MNTEQLKPGPSVVAGLAEIHAALDACESRNAALDRILEAEKFAKAARDAAVDARASLLAERAMQTDPEKVRAYQPRLDELTLASTSAAFDVESAAIARARVEQELEDAETVVREMREAGKHRHAQLAYAKDLGAEWAQRLEAAVTQHLLPLWLEGVAMHAALPSHDMGTWLNESRVHMFGAATSALIDRSEANLAGERMVLGEAWTTMPELVAKQQYVKQIRDRAQLLEAYVPRKLRAAQPPYVPRGRTVGRLLGDSRAAGTATAESDRRPTIEEALAMPGSRQTGGASHHREAREMNMAGRALADPDFEQFR